MIDNLVYMVYVYDDSFVTYLNISGGKDMERISLADTNLVIEQTQGVQTQSALVRLYPKNIDAELLDNLTADMEEEIEKASACRYCNEKCAKGYKFSIRDQAYDKCRFNAFLFTVTEESKPILTDWLAKEVGEL